jgi:superfamily II DNA or RNA helicase
MTYSELYEYGIHNKKKKNWISEYKRKSGDTTTIVHTVIEYKNADSTNLKGINEAISFILQHKYNFIKYNGITKSALLKYTDGFFSNALIIIDEAHNFIRSYVNNSTIITKLYGNIINAKNSKILLLSGTPLINKPFELSALINLVKGPIIQYEIKLNDSNFDINLLKDNKYIDEIKFKKNVIYIELTPHDFVKNNNKIIQEKWINRNETIIQNIIAFLTDKGINVDKKHTSTIYNALPHTESDFNEMFVDFDDNSIINEDLFIRRILGAVSYFRRANDELFPLELEPIIRYIDMSDFQLKEYSTERTKEITADNTKNKFKKKDTKIESTYRAFSRMLCNFVFPSDMNRPYPSDIRKELVNLIENEKDDTTDKDVEEGTFNIKKAAKEEYMKQIEKVVNLIKIKTDLDIAENSPKFVQMMKDMNKHNKVLVYSQFRNIGGLGIFKIILERNDWIELNIEMKNQAYSILNHEEVLKDKYNSKRFIIFNEDRGKTKELMNIFNGNFQDCAPKIQQQLKDATFENNVNTDNNIDGNVINTMMITQSGAEGISLTNVRAVLIMEPYWNNVRIEQVIGRAIRTNSHKNLPQKERNVQVYHYLMKGSKKQLESNIGKTLKLGDNGLTTDEFIQELSNKKTALTSTFLIALKKAAVDCSINALINKKEYKCYAFPINLDKNNLANTANIEDDRLITLYKNMAIHKKIKGTVVKKNNKKYVKFENNIYDYKAYTDAELLIPISDE